MPIFCNIPTFFKRVFDTALLRLIHLFIESILGVLELACQTETLDVLLGCIPIKSKCFNKKTRVQKITLLQKPKISTLTMLVMVDVNFVAFLATKKLIYYINKLTGSKQESLTDFYLK